MLKKGTVLRIQKVLYSMRISPLLWQKEFTSTLKTLGHTAVPHELCCIIKNSIIIFFYTDDTIIAYNKHKSKETDNAVKLLQQNTL